MQTIAAQIKSGELSRFHLLYGEEPYMIRYYKNKLKKMLSNEGDDMNVSFFEGNSLPFEEIGDLGNTLPFFAEKRLIFLENTELFKKSNEMADMLAGFPDTTYVVFAEKQIDKRNRLYKWIQKAGCVTECTLQREKELVPWAGRYLKEYGKSISKDTVEYLISKVGVQMDMLVNELDKVAAYAGDRPEVTAGDVDAICSGQAVGKIFDMIDGVIAGESETVFRLYGDLLELKEPPMRILHLLGRHLNILLQIKEMKGYSDRDVAAKVGIPYFTVRKYKSQAGHFMRKTLISLLQARVEAEERFKTGRMEEKLAAEFFLIKALTNDEKDGKNIRV